MSRGTAHCTCRSCGVKFDKELYTHGAGASKALREKIEWAESGGIDLCTDCWKQEKREKEKAAGLTCKILLGNAMEENPTIYAVFGGDAYSHKDELKALGAYFTDDYPTGGALIDAIGLGYVPKAWVMRFRNLESLREDLIKLESDLAPLGCILKYPSDDDRRFWSDLHAFALSERKKRRENEDAAKAEREAAKQTALEELGPKPAFPERIMALWPAGGCWNGTVYGKPGKRRVYLGGKEVNISDEEATAMSTILAARKKWQCKKDEIEKKYT